MLFRKRRSHLINLSPCFSTRYSIRSCSVERAFGDRFGGRPLTRLLARDDFGQHAMVRSIGIGVAVQIPGFGSNFLFAYRLLLYYGHYNVSRCGLLTRAAVFQDHPFSPSTGTSPRSGHLQYTERFSQKRSIYFGLYCPFPALPRTWRAASPTADAPRVWQGGASCLQRSSPDRDLDTARSWADTVRLRYAFDKEHRLAVLLERVRRRAPRRIYSSVYAFFGSFPQTPNVPRDGIVARLACLLWLVCGPDAVAREQGGE